MITIPPGVRVLVATRPVDFRKGAHGLAALAAEVLAEDPFLLTRTSEPILASLQSRAATEYLITQKCRHVNAHIVLAGTGYV